MKYKARFLGHDLCVGQDLEGGWHCWISGPRPLTHDAAFASAEEAKRFAHSLAHTHLERKNECDCAEELTWIAR